MAENVTCPLDLGMEFPNRTWDGLINSTNSTANSLEPILRIYTIVAIFFVPVVLSLFPYLSYSLEYLCASYQPSGCLSYWRKIKSTFFSTPIVCAFVSKFSSGVMLHAILLNMLPNIYNSHAKLNLTNKSSVNSFVKLLPGVKMGIGFGICFALHIIMDWFVKVCAFCTLNNKSPDCEAATTNDHNKLPGPFASNISKFKIIADFTTTILTYAPDSMLDGITLGNYFSQGNRTRYLDVFLAMFLHRNILGPLTTIQMMERCLMETVVDNGNNLQSKEESNGTGPIRSESQFTSATMVRPQTQGPLVWKPQSTSPPFIYPRIPGHQFVNFYPYHPQPTGSPLMPSPTLSPSSITHNPYRFHPYRQELTSSHLARPQIVPSILPYPQLRGSELILCPPIDSYSTNPCAIVPNRANTMLIPSQSAPPQCVQFPSASSPPVVCHPVPNPQPSEPISPRYKQKLIPQSFSILLAFNVVSFAFTPIGMYMESLITNEYAVSMSALSAGGIIFVVFSEIFIKHGRKPQLPSSVQLLAMLLGFLTMYCLTSNITNLISSVKF